MPKPLYSAVLLEFMASRLNVPDLSALRPNCLRLAVHLVAGESPDDHRVSAFVVNFVRVVDMAVADFISCRSDLLHFWNRADSPTLPLGRLILAAGRFEACITSVKRAMDLLSGATGYRGLAPSMRAILRRRLEVKSSNVVKQIARSRHTIQHLDDRIKTGTLAAGQPIYPSSTELDGMKIGRYKVQFADLARWLTELHTLSEDLVADWNECYAHGK